MGEVLRRTNRKRPESRFRNLSTATGTAVAHFDRSYLVSDDFAESACANERLSEIGRARKTNRLTFRREFRRGDDAGWNKPQRCAVSFHGRGSARFVIFGVLIHLPK